MSFYHDIAKSKRYMVLQTINFMDKYLLVILVFCVVSIPISFVNPTTGELRDPPFLLLFYGSIGGICVIVIYSSYRERQQRQKINSERRKPKK